MRDKPEKAHKAHPSSDVILVVSLHPNLADVRKKVLEHAGFKVISAMNLTTVRDACQKHKVRLVMIGYSLPPAEKRRVWNTLREFCKTPVLELYENGKQELMSSHALSAHESLTPDDFLEALRKILNQPLTAVTREATLDLGRKETPIERTFRKVIGRKISAAERGSTNRALSKER